MSKKTIALSTMLISVLLILSSVEIVTGRGILNGQCTFYQTISPNGKYFNLSQNSTIFFEWLGITTFAVGTLLLFAPNFLLFEQSKKRNIVLVIINIIGMLFEFIFFQSFLYMFMLITLCALFFSNIMILFIQKVRDKFDIFVLILTFFIFFINCYYLFYHFMMYIDLDILFTNDALDMMTEEMINISRINILCLSLWLIPYGALILKEIKDQKTGV